MPEARRGDGDVELNHDKETILSPSEMVKSLLLSMGTAISPIIIKMV